jgi:amidase
MEFRLLLATALLAGLSQAQTKRPPFTVVEATISEMQSALANKRTTSRELVTQYLVRIALYDRQLHSLVTVNPKVLAEADERDRERAAGKLRGPLHGIPIALKDNIHTVDMPTTGGALAFAGLIPPYEATLTRNLREAGAIIIAKTTLIELANWVAGAPTPMAAYNAVVGFGFDPYDPRSDPRESSDGRAVLSPGGSSSGAGTAANLWAANVGSDTGGSIVQPSNQAMLVGIRPTIGRISRYGVIPITADHDTAGPMARSVSDAAILLGALESASPDPNDPATKTCTPPSKRDYVQFLKRDGLKGMRIGIPRAFYYEAVQLPGEQRTRGGLNADQQNVMVRAIEVLKRQGAEIVDPVVIPSFVEQDAKKNFLLWPYCSGADQAKGKDQNCSVNFKYGMKRDFNQWLASLGAAAPVKTLTELREWNLAHAKAGAIKFGQSRIDISDEMDLEGDRSRNEADVKKDQLLSRTNGIDAVLQANHLDAILTPASSAADLSARAGYPLIVVPFAMVPNGGGGRGGQPRQNSYPAGFDPQPAPYGVGFTGAACSEPRLLGIAYAFEQATKARVPPTLFP